MTYVSQKVIYGEILILNSEYYERSICVIFVPRFDACTIILTLSRVTELAPKQSESLFI